MGNVNAKSNRKKKETEEERRQRLQREHGVLMPPSFVNGSRLPITSQTVLRASQSIEPSLLDYLWKTNPGTRLLEEYIHPGISLSIPTVSNGECQGNILIHLQTPPLYQASSVPFTKTFKKTSKKDSIAGTSDAATKAAADKSATTTTTTTNSSTQSLVTPSSGSIIMATHHSSSISPFRLEFMAPTEDSLPSLQVHAGWLSSFGLTARIPLGTETSEVNTNTTRKTTDLTLQNKDATGCTSHSSGWVEAKYKRHLFLSKSGMDVVASAWTSWKDLKDVYEGHKGENHKDPAFHLQAGVEYQQSILAFQTKLPFQAFSGDISQIPKVDTMASINLNYAPEPDLPDSSSKIAPAPLWLSIKQTHGAAKSTDSHTPSWSLNLSQTLAFDRINLNPFDERAPNIRQTLGWVVQVEKRPEQSSNTFWSAGATFQWNRNLATKAILHDGHTLTCSTILKRWKEPRVTLSWIHSFHLPTGTHCPIGFGLEVETMTVSGDEQDEPSTVYPSEEYPLASNLSSKKGGPAMKIGIPELEERVSGFDGERE